MKKFIAMMLAIFMLASILTGCRKAEAPETESEITTTPETEMEEVPVVDPEAGNEPATMPGEEQQPSVMPEVTPENTPSNPPAEQPSIETPVLKPEESTPVVTPSASIDMELSAIIDAMYAIYDPILPAGTIPVDLTDEFSLSSFTGLKDASLIKEAVASESMMGSQAYSVVLVRLNNSADAETVANAMRNGIDQRKWICVAADDIRVVAAGDVVMLCMMDSSFDVKVDTMVETFGSVVGQSFSVDIR